MLIRFIKENHDHYRLECVRRNRTMTSALHEISVSLKHDFLHYIVENSAGLGDGYFGVIAAGNDMDELTPKAMKACGIDPTEECHAAEIVIIALQEALGDHADPSAIVARAEARCHEMNVTPPAYLTPVFVDQALSSFANLYAQWKQLHEGESIEVPFAQSPFKYHELG